MAAPIVPLQCVLTLGATTRLLNGTGAQGSADTFAWANAVPGGHLSASFQVQESERSGNTGIYRYGTRVEIKIAPGAVGAGFVVFTGYMLTPVTSPNGVMVTIEATGFSQLFRDTSDPMLWLTYLSQDWVDLNSKPFGGSFANDATVLDASVKPGTLDLTVQGGQTLTGGDNSGVGFYIDDQILPTRVQGNLRKNTTAANYTIRLIRYKGPSQPGSGVNLLNLSTQIASANKVDAFDTGSFSPLISGIGYPVVTIELTRTGTGTQQSGPGWKAWITDIAVNGNAFQGGRNPSLSYTTDNVVKDFASLLGFSTGKVTAGSTNALPLWNQSGTAWSDTMDHLEKIMTGANGWKWGVWDWVSGAPEVEFRDYATGNTTWTTSGYTSAASTSWNLDTVPSDLFNKVIVTYRRIHSKRKLRYVASVSPNPFAGLDPPLSGRARAKHYHIDEPQPDNSLAKTIGDNLAAYYSTEHYGGTITATYLNTGGVDTWAGKARAGQLITVSDFPGGAKTFRISAVEGTDTGATKLTIGAVPTTIARLMYLMHQRAREHGNHAGHH